MGASKRFVFRIKTKSGGVVGNIAIDAKDRVDAENQLKKKYPDCTILNAEERR